MSTVKRYAALDAMRGLTVAAMLFVNNAGDWSHVFPWLEHATWHGCSPADFIFPFFLFILGASLAMSLDAQLSKGLDIAVVRKSILWRSLRMFLLGVVLHLIAWALIDGRHFRLLGVLQRIGICYAVVACLIIHVRQLSSQIMICLGAMLVYWALLFFGGSYEPHLNLVDKIDTAVLGKLAYSYDVQTGLAQEPEGLLSTFMAMASVMFGVWAGRAMRDGQLKQMLAGAAGLILLALIWSAYLPFNKQLWTPSFVCWTSAWAILLLLAMHMLIDKQGWPALGKSFGVNAIAAYAGAWVATCVLAWTAWDNLIYQQIFAPALVGRFGEDFSSFAYAAAFTLMFAALTFGMNKKGWRITI
ncbi:acyltransferase family protein [Undibacterium sp. Di27W]|uniref:acyltransferase family protein n=1 Tax=Undibacterium sp. Di27W TaxID=3413036 RepID=UPI003BF106CF